MVNRYGDGESVLAVPALADNLERNWGIGIRRGAALLHQDIAADFSGTTGPIISGNILYHLTDILSVGLNVEWEKYNIEVGREDMGYAKTLSLIPFFEVHPINIGALSPYGFFGLGLNVNSFKRHNPRIVIRDDMTPEEKLLLDTLLLNKIDPGNTLALKIGAGADYFATQNLAINLEIGWKVNSGNARMCGPSEDCVTHPWEADAFTFLSGLRYFF